VKRGRVDAMAIAMAIALPAAMGYGHWARLWCVMLGFFDGKAAHFGLDCALARKLIIRKHTTLHQDHRHLM